MYVEIKENKLLSWCENPYLDYEFVDINYETFSPKEYKIVNNTLANRTKDADYILEQAEKEKEIQDKKTITKRQLLFWLFLKKKITEDNIFTAISTIADPINKYLGEKSYTGTNNFEYGNPFVSVIGQALGLTEIELKQCFDEAKDM
jgi:hypothetical protein